MAFIFEDGSGVPGANSYASLEYAVAYFAERNRSSEFAGTDDQRRGWLVQATDYIERFRERFLSRPFFPTQSLSFPRATLSGNAVAWMPDMLVKATCEYAARAKIGPLAPDPVVDKSGHSVVMTGRTVGPIQRTFTVVPGSKAQSFRSYPAADALLAPLLMSAGQRVIR